MLEKHKYGVLIISNKYYKHNIKSVAKALALIEFAPTRLEHNFMKEAFYIEGFSEAFEEIPTCHIAPHYILKITTDENGNLKTSTVIAAEHPAGQTT